MRRPSDQRLRPGSFLLELSLWLAPALVFLWVYTTRLGGAATAVMPHLRVVLGFFAATVLLRGVLVALIGARRAAVAGALLGAACLCTLWLYYAVAVVGFGAWGYMVSWPLIETYMQQAPYLVDVLGPVVYSLGALALAALILVASVLLAFYRRADWLGIAWRVGPGTRRVAAFASWAMLALFAVRYVDLPPADAGEPLALTFWPNTFDRKFQTNLRPQGGLLEREEEAARKAHSGTRPTGDSNVILIVVDALRASSMQVYGYGRATTPFLEGLMKQGSATRSLRAHGVCSESSCGLLGIASSRYIHQLVDNPLTLSEVLRSHGYQAHMVLSGDHTGFYGLRKLYGETDSFVDGRSADGYANDDVNVVQALRRLELRSTRNNFIQVHLMSAHLLGRRAVPDRFGEAKSYATAVAGLEPSAQDRKSFINFYDAGVAQADEMIRLLLDVLRDKGLMDDALVIVTADHGEFVGERGRFGHSKGVFGEVLDIPLILMATGPGAPLKIAEDRRASQVDIAPTVLAYLGVPIPPVWSGVPLQLPTRGAGERQIYFQQNAEFGLMFPKPNGHTWKYWVDAATGQEFAFDLDADPGEANNRAAELTALERQGLRSTLLALEVNVRESMAFR